MLQTIYSKSVLFYIIDNAISNVNSRKSIIDPSIMQSQSSVALICSIIIHSSHLSRRIKSSRDRGSSHPVHFKPPSTIRLFVVSLACSDLNLSHCLIARSTIGDCIRDKRRCFYVIPDDMSRKSRLPHTHTFTSLNPFEAFLGHVCSIPRHPRFRINVLTTLYCVSAHQNDE